MFPTFTGNSRRPRNVNLSGQAAVNPFAASGWNPSATAGTSKALADVQAERRQRQQERDRLRAAQSIQRSWRGHRARRHLRDARRHAFDALYGPSSAAAAGPDQRLVAAFPLLLAVFQAGRPDDRQRLELVTRDLIQTDFRPARTGQIDPERLGKLVQITTTALESDDSTLPSAGLLDSVFRTISIRPQAAAKTLDCYYKLLARYCERGGQDAGSSELQGAVLAPLKGGPNIPESFTLKAYRAFALSFLATPNLTLLEQSINNFAPSVDTDRLSSAILQAAEAGALTLTAKDNLFWLLSHLIHLQKANPAQSRSSVYIKALSAQLSRLSGDIRSRLLAITASEPIDASSTSKRTLPPYVTGALKSLVDKEEVSDVLETFASNYGSGTTQEVEDASLLAGYILTLIRCFPDYGDDIRMRLYLADITSRAGRTPSVKFFWNAMSRTAVFSNVFADENSALNFLRRRKYFQASDNSGVESAWDREWRMVLLFLELYIFVLRLTDDDDFFNAIGTSPMSQTDASSRLRSCGLRLDELKRLTIFLRNLAFTLYYNAASLLQEDISRGVPSVPMDELWGTSSSRRSARDAAKADGKTSSGYRVVSGVDFNAFKGIVTTAMRMLYERDSRRRFLPSGHWLMTSRFDMEGFLGAVVQEEERRHEMAEKSGNEDDADSDDEDVDMGDDDDDDDDDDDNYRPFSTVAHQRRSQYARVEAFKQARRVRRDAMLAVVRPKLEILRNMPFVIPFETRVQIFRQFVHLDKRRRRGGYVDPDQWRLAARHRDPLGNPELDVLGRHSAKIKRGQLFEDAFDQFYTLGDGLKEPISITFVDRFDTIEAGIDGGGVTKEFLTSVTKEAFAEATNFFTASSQNYLYPNPCAIDQRQEALRAAGVRENSDEWGLQMTDLLEQYEFLGRIVGKCMYEGILIDIAFAGFFLLKWSATGADASYRANINDLREMDEQLYQGMLGLKNYPGDVGDLALDFTITDRVSMPNEEPVRTITRNLMPGGDAIAVTNENRPLYISYVARHRLLKQPLRQTAAFLRGLGSIISPAWLSMFNQSELQRLVGGDMSEIDVDDLRRSTVYSGVYQIGDDGLEHPTVQLFWDVMRSLADSERRDVVKYVTSSPRAPLLGFAQLNPPFSIRDGGTDQDRLPSASTCVNLLKLPQYRSAAALRSKLLYAVSSGAGFDLS